MRQIFEDILRFQSIALLKPVRKIEKGSGIVFDYKEKKNKMSGAGRTPILTE